MKNNKAVYLRLLEKSVTPHVCIMLLLMPLRHLKLLFNACPLTVIDHYKFINNKN